MMFDKDAGHKVFMDDTYENESRMLGSVWNPATIPWTDVVYSTSLYRLHCFCFVDFWLQVLNVLIGCISYIDR